MGWRNRRKSFQDRQWVTKSQEMCFVWKQGICFNIFFNYSFWFWTYHDYNPSWKNLIKCGKQCFIKSINLQRFVFLSKIGSCSQHNFSSWTELMQDMVSFYKIKEIIVWNWSRIFYCIRKYRHLNNDNYDNMVPNWKPKSKPKSLINDWLTNWSLSIYKPTFLSSQQVLLMIKVSKLKLSHDDKALHSNFFFAGTTFYHISWAKHISILY